MNVNPPIDKYFSLDVQQLQNKYKNKCNTRSKIYEKLLEKCYYRINTAAENDDTYCLYSIPEFILGMPLYNLAYCAAFIIHSLKSNGFNAQFYNPNIIFVAWQYEAPSYIKNNTKKVISITDNNLLTPPTTNAIKTEKKTIFIEPKKPTIVNNGYRSTTDYKPSGKFIF